MALAARAKAWGRGRLTPLLLAHPGAGLALAGALGRHLGRFPGLEVAPTAEEVEAFYGPLPRSEVARIRRAIGALERRNQALFLLLRQRGLEPVMGRVRTRGEERLRALGDASVGALVLLWHVGVPVVPLAAFARLGIPALSLGQGDPFPVGHVLPAPVRYVIGEERRLSFLRQALEQLRAGGVVFLAPDGEVGSAFLEVPFCGRAVPVGRGAARLARRSGARIVPATTRWTGRGGEIEMTFHEPLAPLPDPPAGTDDYERALLAATAAWFERYVRANPGELRLRWLRQYLARPPLAPATGGPGGYFT